MRIGDFADVRGGKRLPNGAPLLDHPTAHPYIRLVDVVDRRINNANVKYLSPEIHKQISSYIVSGHDVCLAIVGHTIGLVFYVDEKWHGANLTENAARITNIKGVDPRYLFYVLSSSYGLEEIKARTVGSAQGKLPLYSIRDIEVLIPSLLEQRAIAHILGTLDDKIELNRRMNETLEAMARALFKSWFVDFDPVRAIAKGRDPDLPQSVADLFPDSFEDSELGEIPKGWGVGTLGDVLWQRVERCEASDETASRPYVPIDCITSRSLFLAESKPGVEAQSSLTRFYKGDLLFGAMRPYFHKVCIAPFDGTTRTTAFVLAPKRSQDFGFATLLLHHPDTIDYATRHSRGTTIPYAVWTSSLEDMPAVIPPPQVRESFDSAVRTTLDRIPTILRDPHALRPA
jgi:type I restriction enzyme S subunit